VNGLDTFLKRIPSQGKSALEEKGGGETSNGLRNKKGGVRDVCEVRDLSANKRLTRLRGIKEPVIRGYGGKEGI